MSEERLRLELSRVIAGRPISIVGNATSLLTKAHGATIDSGCVLRMNAGIPIDNKAQGRRTDIHCFSNMPSLQTNLGSARGKWLRWRNVRSFNNALRIWMNLAKREMSEDPDQLFYPEESWQRLAEVLHAPPSVGAMVLDMVATFAEEAEVHVFGFDFKNSTTFYRKRDKLGHHDWDAERNFANDLCEQRNWVFY